MNFEHQIVKIQKWFRSFKFENKKFVSSKITTSHGNSWRCANVPYKIIEYNREMIKLLPFNGKTPIDVLNKNFETEFYYLKNDKTYIYTSNYPNGRIPISEFDIKPLSLKNLKKHFKSKTILNLIEKAERDSFHSKGNNFCITIDEYNKYKTEPKNSKLKRIGDPVFNRSVRHSPPISKIFTYKDFENSPSYPAPIGIREEDFALPSEQNEILIEMLNQIFSCKNAPECPEQIKRELGLNIKLNSHICLWCGELMDISELNQDYCSTVHSVNFCHRIPEIGTKKGNVYIGHCSCNREQGGYSEEQRIEQIIHLVKCNPSYKDKIIKELA